MREIVPPLKPLGSAHLAFADTPPSYACTVFQQTKPANDKLEDWEKTIADSNARLDG